MSIEIKLPEIGDGITSGDVLEIFVAEGESVDKDQMIVELETDKATVPIYAPHGGQISKIHVSPGDTIDVGGLLISLEASQQKSEPSAPVSDAKPPSPAEPTPGSEDDVSATPPAQSATPPAQSATPPAQSATPPAKSTSPSSPPAPSPDPTPAPTPAPATASLAGDKTSDDTAVADAPAVARKPPAPPASSRAKTGAEKAGFIPAGPSVRRFAREVGVELQDVDGTGLGGRITRDDVIRHVRRSADEQKSIQATPNPDPQKPAAATASKSSPTRPASGSESTGERGNDEFGPIRIEKMSRIRRTIAANMHESWTTIPRVTNFDDADVTELEEFRQASKADYAERGIKLTSMPFVIKAVASALRSHPMINASLSDDGQIIYKDYVNIGIAVDSERGLVVPVIRNADRLSIPEIATALGELAGQVRSGSIGLDALRGGTFTISNLGAIGGSYSTPIINSPEVAILLAGRSRKTPVIVDDQIVARLMMPLSLSYDHRLVDGGAAARFLNELIDYLSAPGRLLLAP